MVTPLVAPTTGEAMRIGATMVCSPNSLIVHAVQPVGLMFVSEPLNHQCMMLLYSTRYC